MTIKDKAFRQLEKDYYAMLHRYVTCPLDSGYKDIEAEFRKVRDEYEAAKAVR